MTDSLPDSQLEFNSFSMNVKPFVLPRSLDSFRSPILIFEIDIDHPSYLDLKHMLYRWVRQTKLTIGRAQSIDFTRSTSPQAGEGNLSKLSKEKVYFCDLRDKKDQDLGLHITTHPQAWINDLAASLSLDVFRGLFVFTDSITKVPACWISKSIAGLTSNSDLGTFIKKGLGIYKSTIQPIKTNHTKLCGYVKMIREHRMVEW